MRENIAAGHADTQTTDGVSPAGRVIKSIAEGWTPAVQAEHANYTRMKAQGITLSSNMHMALGYAEQAKAAHDQISTEGK